MGQVVKFPGMSEAELSDCVIQTARLFGWRVAHFRAARTNKGWRTPVAADGKGFPDLVLARQGRVIFAELKADKGQLSPEQRSWLDELNRPRQGAESHGAVVWRPADWCDGSIERILREPA